VPCRATRGGSASSSHRYAALMNIHVRSNRLTTTSGAVGDFTRAAPPESLPKGVMEFRLPFPNRSALTASSLRLVGISARLLTIGPPHGCCWPIALRISLGRGGGQSQPDPLHRSCRDRLVAARCLDRCSVCCVAEAAHRRRRTGSDLSSLGAISVATQAYPRAADPESSVETRILALAAGWSRGASIPGPPGDLWHRATN